MSLIKRMSKAQLARAARPICVLLLSLGGATGCGSYPTLRDDPINCSVADGYDFDPTPVSLSAWCSPDGVTPDASASADQPPPTGDQGVCGSTSALVFHASHNNDWGSTCGFNNFGTRNELAYDGLSFWARATGDTSKGFTISLYDANDTPGGNCKVYAVDGGTAGQIIVTMVDPSNPNNVISGAATASRMPDECGNNRGNGYDHVMEVTSEWALYTIPWVKFTQWAYPNRVPNSILTDTGNVDGTGLLTDQLMGIGLRPPKEAPFELWISNITFYRKKPPDAGQ